MSVHNPGCYFWYFEWYTFCANWRLLKVRAVNCFLTNKPNTFLRSTRFYMNFYYDSKRAICKFFILMSFLIQEKKVVYLASYQESLLSPFAETVVWCLKFFIKIMQSTVLIKAKMFVWIVVISCVKGNLPFLCIFISLSHIMSIIGERISCRVQLSLVHCSLH